MYTITIGLPGALGEYRGCETRVARTAHKTKQECNPIAPNLVLNIFLRGQRRTYTAKKHSGQLFRLFNRLDVLEAPLVRTLVSRSQSPLFRSFCVLLSRLGDGWPYLAIGVALFILRGWAAYRPALAASISVGIGQLGYAFIKPWLARIRPCEADPAMDCSFKALDRYSCPSGHCLTVTALGIPLAWACPDAIPVVALIILLMAFARISLGHHYPTDVFFGIVVGGVASLPVSALVL